MSGYHKLDLSKLSLSNELISYEDALANVTPLNIPKDVHLGKRKLQAKSVEGDRDNKCVKLEIFC